MDEKTLEILKNKKKKYRLITILCSIFFFLTGSISTFTLYNYFFGGGLEQGELAPFQQAYNIIKNEWYFGSDEITEQYFNEAMQGLVNGNIENGVTRIDPYLRYYPAPKQDEVKQYGIGIEVITDGYGYPLYDGYYYISKVYGHSAANGILKEGDLLSAVNGESIRYKPTSELKILGEKDTEVDITYLRDGKEETVTLVRQNSVEHTVESRLYTDYAVLEIDGFTTNEEGQLGTAQLADEKLKIISQEGIKNLVIDLRENPGGYIAAFKELADLFIDNNKSLGHYINKNQEIIEYAKTKSSAKYEFDEIIILINGNSASASESFTASMVDNLDNVTVCGTTSYGKGIAQRTISLSDGSSLKYTYAEYIRPNGNKLHNIGVEPSVVINQDEVAPIDRSLYYEGDLFLIESYCLAGKTYYDNLLASRAKQLAEAVELFD